MIHDAKLRIRRFEEVILPHMPAAYNLARWLTNDSRDAEDVVQESCLRAFRFLESFHGGDARAWLLKIVRNSSYTWIQNRRTADEPFVDELQQDPSGDSRPDRALEVTMDRETVRTALGSLPIEFREVVILRELDGLSYKEIGEIAGIPLGTVMSRLARGRNLLRKLLTRHDFTSEQHGL